VILIDFLCGLSLIVLFLGLLLTTLGKVREGDIKMASRRQAIYQIEAALAQMQVPGSEMPQFNDVMSLERLPQPVDDERYVWVRVTVKVEGQQASLDGLVCREYVGGGQ
jgi:hypothetical protein